MPGAAFRCSGRDSVRPELEDREAGHGPYRGWAAGVSLLFSFRLGTGGYGLWAVAQR